jgi:hypothetical protein
MADKGRLSIEQHMKIVLFFTETRSVVVTQRWFHAHFQMQWAPSFRIIHKLYNQLNSGGSVLEKKCHRPSSARSLENVTVTVALQRSPSKSTRKAAAQIGII